MEALLPLVREHVGWKSDPPNANLYDTDDCLRLLRLLDEGDDVDETQVNQSGGEARLLTTPSLPPNAQTTQPLLYEIAQRVHRVQAVRGTQHTSVWNHSRATWPTHLPGLMLFCMVHSRSRSVVIDIITTQLDTIEQSTLMCLLEPLKQEFLRPELSEEDLLVAEVAHARQAEAKAKEEAKMHRRAHTTVIETKQLEIERAQTSAQRAELRAQGQSRQIEVLEERVQTLMDEVRQRAAHQQDLARKNTHLQSALEKQVDVQAQLDALLVEVELLRGADARCRRVTERNTALSSQHANALAELQEMHQRHEQAEAQHTAEVLQLTTDRDSVAERALQLTALQLRHEALLVQQEDKIMTLTKQLQEEIEQRRADVREESGKQKPLLPSDEDDRSLTWELEYARAESHREEMGILTQQLTEAQQQSATLKQELEEAHNCLNQQTKSAETELQETRAQLESLRLESNAQSQAHAAHITELTRDFQSVLAAARIPPPKLTSPSSYVLPDEWRTITDTLLALQEQHRQQLEECRCERERQERRHEADRERIMQDARLLQSESAVRYTAELQAVRLQQSESATRHATELHAAHASIAALKDERERKDQTHRDELERAMHALSQFMNLMNSGEVCTNVQPKSEALNKGN